jgi:hypothetical protein
MIDSLKERLRTSDVIFMFKNTIIMVLPHTDSDATVLLLTRLKHIISMAFTNSPVLSENSLSFPCPEITRSSQVYDWAENQLR